MILLLKWKKRGEWIEMWKTELFLEYIEETPTSLLNESFVWPTPISLQRWSGSAFWQKRSHPCRDTGATTITPKGKKERRTWPKRSISHLRINWKIQIAFLFRQSKKVAIKKFLLKCIVFKYSDLSIKRTYLVSKHENS